MKEIQILRKMD
jgi:calcium/calmodulin-dependent protein kinase I